MVPALHVQRTFGHGTHEGRVEGPQIHADLSETHPRVPADVSVSGKSQPDVGPGDPESRPGSEVGARDKQVRQSQPAGCQASRE